MNFSEIPKVSTRLVGDCVKQLVIHKLIREATREDKYKKQIVCGNKRYVLTDSAERQIKGLMLVVRDLFPEASAGEVRSGTLAFLSLAKMGDMLDKKLYVYLGVLNFLAEGNIW